MKDSALITKARLFAFAAHDAINHVRKYTGEPYTVHLANVAGIVSEVTDDEEMIAAAFLHDTVEDTKVTLDVLRSQFPLRVVMLVDDLTDISKPEQGNRKIRKAIDRAHTAMAHPDAKTIKLADLMDNTSTIVKFDPNFAKVYLREKSDLLMVLQEGNPKLLVRATQMVSDALKELFGERAVG